MKNEVSVLAVPLGKNPILRLIPSNNDGCYEAVCAIVGGGICSQEIAPRLRLIANDNGLSRRLQYNRCGHVGNLVIAKYSSAGNIILMTDKDIEVAKEWLTRNDHRPPFCHVCGKPGGVTMFCTCRDVLIYCEGCYKQCFQVMNGNDMDEKKRFALCSRCRHNK
jgi:hypothetical protein